MRNNDNKTRNLKQCLDFGLENNLEVRIGGPNEVLVDLDTLFKISKKQSLEVETHISIIHFRKS